MFKIQVHPTFVDVPDEFAQLIKRLRDVRAGGFESGVLGGGGFPSRVRTRARVTELHFGRE